MCREYERKPFIIFEGIDGCGKSTALRLLASYIEKTRKEEVLVTSEPTDLPSGRLLRKALSGKMEGVTKDVLLGMFLADRAEHQSLFLSKAENTWCLCDRYSLSNAVYNSDGIEDMRRIEGLNSDFLKPTFTFYIDTPVDVCLERINSRGESKEIFENREKLESVKVKYDILADEGKMIRIDGNQEPYEILEDLVSILGI